LLAARKRNEKRPELGLADRIRAARSRNEAAFVPASGSGGGQDHGEGRRADCLEERIRRARERLERAQTRTVPDRFNSIAGGCQSLA
jgi:hypothetical protein